MVDLADLDQQIEDAYAFAKSRLALAQKDFDAIDQALRYQGEDADEDLRQRHAHFAQLHADAKAGFAHADARRNAHRETWRELKRSGMLAEADALEAKAAELRKKANGECHA